MRYFLLCILLSLSIAGCSQFASQPAPPLTDSQVNVLTPPPEQWKINAKLGIKVPEQSGSVSLQWEQWANSYRIQVQAPLGQGSAVIYGNPDNIVIKRPGKPTLSSNNANTLIQEAFGWNFPLNQLKFWIRGLPNPELTIDLQQQNASGTLDKLEQSEWEIVYSRHQLVEQWQVPGKIVARQGNTRLTMIIRQWEFL